MRPSFTLACLALALAAKLSLAQAPDISQPTVPTDIPAWESAEMNKLHSASADAITLVSAAVSELTNASNPNHARTNSKLFAKYFAPGDADVVLDVFMSITGEGVSSRSDRLEQVYFSKTDVHGVCDWREEALMYTTPVTFHDAALPSYIVVCPQMWQVGALDLGGIKCEETCEDFENKTC